MKLSHRERQLLALFVVLQIIFIGIEVFARLYEAFIRVADVFIIFGAAWVLAYLLSPLVNAIDRRTRLNRAGAVFVVYAAIAVVFGGLLAIGMPGLAAQLDTLRDRGPELATNTAEAAKGLQEQLDRAGVPVNIGQLVASLPQQVGESARNIAADALGLVTATAAILFNLILVLIIAFLILLDGGSLWQRFTGALPAELRSEADLFRQSADKSFGGFVRGSLLLGLLYGIATLLYLVPLGVPFAGVLALIAGLAVVIPFFGPFIAVAPVITITILGAPDKLLWVLAITVILQQVTLNIIGPRILGAAVGIHPLFVFLALLLGQRIAGFWGILLAMPIAGILATFGRYGYELAAGFRRRTEAGALIEDQAAKAVEAGEGAKRDAEAK